MYPILSSLRVKTVILADLPGRWLVLVLPAHHYSEGAALHGPGLRAEGLLLCSLSWVDPGLYPSIVLGPLKG